MNACLDACLGDFDEAPPIQPGIAKRDETVDVIPHMTAGDIASARIALGVDDRRASPNSSKHLLFPQRPKEKAGGSEAPSQRIWAQTRGKRRMGASMSAASLGSGPKAGDEGAGMSRTRLGASN
jgi:hypothetical protein